MTSTEITKYIADLNRTYQTGNATEHSYRPALQRFLEDTLKAQKLPKLDALQITNEPKRIDCGAPDYIATRNDIPVGYIEAKDIGDADLSGKKANKEQFDRYKQTLGNIIFTDYLDFHFYRNGEFTESVRIGEVKDGKIVPVKDSADKFDTLISQFGHAEAQSITSSDALATIMAAKARLMAGVIENVLSKPGGDSALAEQMEAFKNVLIPDITPKVFADVYAQTIAYGMFVARLHHKSTREFSREEAAKLIPKTNPFLRQLFQNIAGYDLDERIRWIVDDLAEAFKATDVEMVMAGFGEDTQQNDPMIHFYEDFLSAYDP
ncbi:MAG: adenine specific DNA methyltransferase, partial [Chitinispirillia bacterium]|nr:adenine specific DNA methyltransferase [Chitinispirillia bacterium]